MTGLCPSCRTCNIAVRINEALTVGEEYVNPTDRRWPNGLQSEGTRVNTIMSLKFINLHFKMIVSFPSNGNTDNVKGE
jgi:hypothetical protein